MKEHRVLEVVGLMWGEFEVLVLNFSIQWKHLWGWTQWGLYMSWEICGVLLLELKEMATHPSTLAGKSHGWKSLVGYSPWGHKVGHDWATSPSLRIEREAGKEGFPGGSVRKESARSSGDRFNPRVGKIPGGGNDNLLQYPWLGNPMDRGAWWATIRRITKRRTQVKQMSTHT